MPTYFMLQEEQGQWLMKIGRAKNLHERLRNLQTGNPKELKYVGWIRSLDERKTEQSLHQKYRGANVGGEWFALQPADIFDDLQQAGIDGFVAKNAYPFDVVGSDRKGVPEYLGVWDWGELEVYECCPFCGCMCGMDFQDASQMYHCRQCGRVTDFSEVSPKFDNEEDYLVWKSEQNAQKAARPKPLPRKRFVT